MTERLASSTVRGSGILLAFCLLVGVCWLWLLSQHTPHRWAGVCWLLLLAVYASQALFFYEVTLSPSAIRLARLFARPVRYGLTDFVALETTRLPGRPVRIRFADGRSYLFEPRLKESYWSLRYTPTPDFIAYWNAEINSRAGRDDSSFQASPAAAG